jgi:hypothetical protein
MDPKAMPMELKTWAAAYTHTWPYRSIAHSQIISDTLISVNGILMKFKVHPSRVDQIFKKRKEKL